MTPAMHLSAICASYVGVDAEKVKYDLRRAFALGHSFGLERAASLIDQCNREGPYNAIGAANRIRALEVVSPTRVDTFDEDFQP